MILKIKQYLYFYFQLTEPLSFTLFLPAEILPIIYGLNFLVKCFLMLSYLLGLIIKQKPTPQLNVLSISLSDIPFLLSHLKIFKALTSLRLISATKLSGITLLMLSAKPPPVILAHPFIKLLSINFNTSFT